eukprot:3882815-Pyramimonas_sp.AAC.1
MSAACGEGSACFHLSMCTQLEPGEAAAAAIEGSRDASSATEHRRGQTDEVPAKERNEENILHERAASNDKGGTRAGALQPEASGAWPDKCGTLC